VSFQDNQLYEKSYGVYSQDSINYTKSMVGDNKEPYISAYKQLISLADKALQEDSNPTPFLRIPPVYENTQGHINASRPLVHDAYRAFVLSIAWKLTDEKKYSSKAEQILDAWAENNKLISHREDAPLVSAYGGVGLINAALLLKENKSWNQSNFRQWVEYVYLPAVSVARNTENNWADWGNLASLVSYSYLDRKKDFQKEIDYTKFLIGSQIGIDGEMVKEISRKENGMFYTYFALAPLTQSLYVICNETGLNLFNVKTSEGLQVKKALDYYYYFVEHPNEWPHYKGADLNKPNKYWPSSLYEAMSGVYPQSDFDASLKRNQPILGGYLTIEPHHIAWNFPTLMKPRLNDSP